MSTSHEAKLAKQAARRQVAERVWTTGLLPSDPEWALQKRFKRFKARNTLEKQEKNQWAEERKADLEKEVLAQRERGKSPEKIRLLNYAGRVFQEATGGSSEKFKTRARAQKIPEGEEKMPAPFFKR